MKFSRDQSLVAALALLLLAPTAFAAKDTVAVRAYVTDSCIIADEPFFVPVAPGKDGSDPATAKFLPLIGLVIGKLAELFINHEIKASANHYKSGVARKDTRYAMSREMNLYRADLEPAPVLRINADLGCMTVVAGTFKPDTADCTAAYQPKELTRDSINLPQSEWKTSRTDDSMENQLRRANICMEGNVRAVYEARFEFSNDGTAYRLKDAGYRVDALLTTEKKGASRTTLYTLKITNPGATDQQEVLSSAWVNIGSVTAGAHSTGAKADAAPWLRVPPLSPEARRNFDEKTRIHQEVQGQIEALQRAQTRNERQLANLDKRIATASGEMLDGLKQERTRIAVQDQSQRAELEARHAEYADLPHTTLEFMPVTIEVAVTESESEKKAQVALADIVGSNSDLVASDLGNAVTGFISKSANINDIKIEPEGSESAGQLDRARDRYYDALIDVQTQPSAHASPAATRNLVETLAQYNAARRSLGLEQLQ